MDDTGLQDTKQEINWLHERTQTTKSDLSTHEAVCAERYEQLQKTLEDMDSAIKENSKQIGELHKMALEGKTSFRTILFMGGFSVALATFLYTILGIIGGR